MQDVPLGVIMKVRVKERTEVPYSQKFSPAKNFRQEKISPNLSQQHYAKLLRNLFSHTSKFLLRIISALCKRCVDALRRSQATSKERQCCVRGYHLCIDAWDASIGEELDCV